MTREELKLSVLIRLAFTNQEIASFLSIQKESVTKRKLRLKQHLKEGYPGEMDNLESFFARF